MLKNILKIKKFIPVYQKDKYLINILNLLIFLIPLSYIAGNTIINANIFIFIVFGILNYKLSIFRFKKDFILFTTLLFFVFIIYSSLYNFFDNNNLVNLIKSISFMRFFIFILIIKQMIENNHLRVKEFFLFSLLLSCFVASDVIFQEIFGFNFFGMQPQNIHRLSGIFGDELIAGAYLYRFGMIGILFFLINKTIFKFDIRFQLLFSIILIGIILTTNRMPLISFLAVIFLSTVLIKENRIFFIKLFSLSLLIFGTFFLTHDRTNDFYNDFFEKGFKITHSIIIDASRSAGILNKQKQESAKKNIKVENNFQKQGWHINIFYTAIETWKMKPYIGGGIKSFRNLCWKIDPTEENVKRLRCGNHPHNYFLEILSEFGLFGLIIFFTFLLSIFYKLFIKDLKTKYNLDTKYISYFFLLLFFIEFFPLKTTGSFFTTGNATYIFLIASFLIGKKKIKVK
jgi:O-antigen ligase|tara:strand:+ start:89 stop:1459 length:1371 start_codon:yes stop_codon:yes gene_type:complete